MTESNDPNDPNQVHSTFELERLSKEITELRKEKEELIYNNQELSKRVYDTEAQLRAYVGIEASRKFDRQDIAAKDKEIQKLNERILQLQEKNREETKQIIVDFVKKNGSLETQFYIYKDKAGQTDFYEKLNEAQKKQISDLEEKLRNEERLRKEELDKKEIQHKNEFESLKRKMMEHIQSSQKKMKESNLENLDLNSKLTRLFTNQLLLELEEQSKQIEDLLKIKEKYQKQIFELKQDLNLHKKVENILQEKNNKYLGMLKAMEEKLELAKQEKLPGIDNVGETDNNESTSSIQKRSFNKDKSFLKKDKDQELFERERLLWKKDKEVQALKDNLGFYKDKEKYFQNKFLDIINIYQTAIDEIVEDPQFNNLKEVDADSTLIREKVKKGDFASLNKQEQYSVLVFLVKHLLPLINSMDPGDSIIEQKIKNYNNKFDSIELSGNLTSKLNSTWGSEKPFYKSLSQHKVASNKFMSSKWNANLTYNKFHPKKRIEISGRNTFYPNSQRLVRDLSMGNK